MPGQISTTHEWTAPGVPVTLNIGQDLPFGLLDPWHDQLQEPRPVAIEDVDALRKIWKFRTFSEAWGFMSRVALACEKANHHPEWTKTFNVVDVVLTTHDCDGLSALDIQLAQKMDKLAGNAQVQTDHSEPVTCLCKTR